jgi:hypothetical protein
VSESQKVECRWSGWVPFLGFGAGRLGRLEPHQTRLLRVDRQAVLAHPLGQDLHDSLSVGFSGSPNRKVIRVADQERLAFQTGANFLLEPFVQHVVQEDVGQEWADHAPNNVANYHVGGRVQKGTD